MLFSTLSFAVFMTIVFLVYWLLPHKFRWIVLLLANTYFYLSFDIKYLLVLGVTMTASYFVAIAMEKSSEAKRKKWILAAGAGATLLVLFVFKYLNFVLYTVQKVLEKFSMPMEETTLNLLAPIGISFYTFQMVGYLVDVYRGKTKAEKHFGKYAIFVSFFPNISSGPIERADHFIPQIDKEKTFDYGNVVYGSRQLLWGLLKKVAFADFLARYVDLVFNDVLSYTGMCFILVILLYTFQIYFDFSGYSDMAIGVARMLGFELMTNFKSPYFATSIRDFWGRWHISLSTWFKDYVYIPLGGNRVSKLRTYINLMITFLVSGLWHGASWTFVLWGGIHGAAQVMERVLKETWAKVFGKVAGDKDGKKATGIAGSVAATIVTFCVVSFAWMFFRANSISEAFYIVKNMFTNLSLSSALMKMTMSGGTLLLIAAMIGCVMVFDFINRKRDMLLVFGKSPVVFRWIVYFVAGVIVVASCMHGDTTQEFIYFNF